MAEPGTEGHNGGRSGPPRVKGAEKNPDRMPYRVGS